MRSYELHATAKQVARSSGRSSVAAAAYRSGTCLEDERTGIVHDYTKKQGVEHSQIYIPDNAPVWAKNAKDSTALRSKLWNASEEKENRSNSTTAHELEVAFPSEFNLMQRRETGDAISREIMRRYNVAVDISYHVPNKSGDERNFHSHILFTTRGFDEKSKDGWARTKFRDLSKDAKDINGNPYLDDEGNKTTRGKLEILSLREFTANEMNRIAEREKLKVHTEHLSFEKRGVNREPTQHLGANASQIEREGKQSERGDINRAIRAANDNLRLFDELRKKAEYHISQRQKTKEAFEKRQAEQKDLAALHKKQREDLQAQKEKLIKQRLNELKDRNRSKWADIYRRQEQENNNFEQSTGSAFGRLRYFIKNKECLTAVYDEKGHLSDAFKSVLNRDLLAQCLKNRHENERKNLAVNVSDEKKRVYNQFNAEYLEQLEVLKAHQHDDRHIMKVRHSDDSLRRAEDVASGKAKEEFDAQKKAQEVQEAFNKKAQEKPPEAKKEFNKRREFRVFRDYKEQRERTSNDNRERDSGLNNEFTVFRDMKERREQSVNNNQQKNSGIKKEFNVFRKMKEGRESEKNRDKGGGGFANRNTDIGRQI